MKKKQPVKLKKPLGKSKEVVKEIPKGKLASKSKSKPAPMSTQGVKVELKSAPKKQDIKAVQKSSNKSSTKDKITSKTTLKEKTTAPVGKGPLNKVATSSENAKSKLIKENKTQKPAKKNELEDSLLEADSDLDLGQDEMIEYAAELEMVEDEEGEIESSASVVAVWTSESKSDEDAEVVLTDAEGRRYCRAKDCDQIGLVDGYCRFHYLLLWKKIQVRRKILADGKLQRYVDELTSRYPDKFLEVIRKDLRTEKDFLSAIQELEIDESAGDSDFEEDTNFIEEVRGMGESAAVDDDDF
ncbi:MAG TPA: hypothetical protein PLJ21_00350 [Pseudobdellovibrionaceae bacterium]|nr:hypothetical protein [Pseudobdellovibrionaceae bacterium]